MGSKIGKGQITNPLLLNLRRGTQRFKRKIPNKRPTLNQVKNNNSELQRSQKNETTLKNTQKESKAQNTIDNGIILKNRKQIGLFKSRNKMIGQKKNLANRSSTRDLSQGQSFSPLGKKINTKILDGQKTLEHLTIDHTLELFCSILLTQNAKSYSLGVCRLFNVMNLIKPTIYQILITALPVLPILQLPLLIAMELGFFLSRMLPFIFGYYYISWARLFADIVRFVFLEGFFICCCILCFQSGNEEVPLSSSIQGATIFLIFLGVVFEYLAFVTSTIYILYTRTKNWMKGTQAKYKYLYYRLPETSKKEVDNPSQSNEEDKYFVDSFNNKTSRRTSNLKKWVEAQKEKESPVIANKERQTDKTKSKKEIFWFDLEDEGLEEKDQTKKKSPSKTSLDIFKRDSFRPQPILSPKKSLHSLTTTQKNFSPKRSIISPTRPRPRMMSFNPGQARTLRKSSYKTKNRQDSFNALKLNFYEDSDQSEFQLSLKRNNTVKVDKIGVDDAAKKSVEDPKSPERTFRKKIYLRDLKYY